MRPCFDHLKYVIIRATLTTSTRESCPSFPQHLCTPVTWGALSLTRAVSETPCVQRTHLRAIGRFFPMKEIGRWEEYWKQEDGTSFPFVCFLRRWKIFGTRFHQTFPWYVPCPIRMYLCDFLHVRVFIDVHLSDVSLRSPVCARIYIAVHLSDVSLWPAACSDICNSLTVICLWEVYVSLAYVGLTVFYSSAQLYRFVYICPNVCPVSFLIVYLSLPGRNNL